MKSIITYPLDSGEYMMAVAKAFGLSEHGIQSMTISAEFGFPVFITFNYLTEADQRLIQVTIPRIPTDEP